MGGKKSILIIITVTVVIVATSLFYGLTTAKKKTVAEQKKETVLGWKEEFTTVSEPGGPSLPKGWILENKPGTEPATFSVEVNTKDKSSFLHMEADKASAALITRLNDVDLKKTPILRWQWRVGILPEGADGRVKSKDDQAIGIYVGTGNILNNKSVSYRWDTETPRGAEGTCAYGLGTVKVKWYTLRNREDISGGRWFIEERNIAEDFKKSWGFYPEEIYISVSCNSQYTNSQAAADIDWIELISR